MSVTTRAAVLPFVLADRNGIRCAGDLRTATTHEALVVGALPFDRHESPLLLTPATGDWMAPPAGITSPHHGDAPAARWRMREEPAPATYGAHVATALAAMSASSGNVDGATLRKVVLSRTLVAEAEADIDIPAVIAALQRDADATVFVLPLPSDDALPRVLVGASPELLVSRQGRHVASSPLAGSARRHADPVADRDAAAQLLASDKNRREHATVVEWIADHLAPFCESLHVPDAPTVSATSSMWHLKTAITGRLHADPASALTLAQALHPTPAVCGVPLEAAYRTIQALEHRPRGFFTGAVGWTDRSGDGHWVVAIRCAEIEGRQARLWAGAGIVPGSVPEQEVAETAAKFRTLSDALGLTTGETDTTS